MSLRRWSSRVGWLGAMGLGVFSGFTHGNAAADPADPVREVLISAAHGLERTLDFGSESGAQPGAIFTVPNGNATVRLRVMQVAAKSSTAFVLDAAQNRFCRVGDTAQFAGFEALPILPESAPTATAGAASPATEARIQAVAYLPPVSASLPPARLRLAAAERAPVTVVPETPPGQMRPVLRPIGGTGMPQRSSAAPGIAFGIPTAYGRGAGRAAFGLAWQENTRINMGQDGVAGASFGFGDRQKVAFDLGVNLLSLTHNGGLGGNGFGGRGSFNLKVHRALANDLSVAVGVQNTLIWGGSDAPTRLYGAVSKMVRLKPDQSRPFSRLYFTGGLLHRSTAGWHSELRPEARAVIAREGHFDLFGSVALRVAEPVNVFGEWSGESLNLGVSFVPFRRYPFTLTPVLADVAGYRPNGTRFNLGFGLPFSY